MNAAVERRLTAKLVVDAEHSDVQVRLLWLPEYHPDVQLLTRFDHEPIGWTFPLYLLADGLAVDKEEAAATDGCVRVWSSPLRLFVDVESDDGIVRYALLRGQAEAALTVIDQAIGDAIAAEWAQISEATP
jgi:hypothetical protein